jgi:hypothetical protein
MGASRHATGDGRHYEQCKSIHAADFLQGGKKGQRQELKRQPVSPD